MLRKKKPEENKPGSPAWMTTYGDMMTLLLVFFVFMYSFSVMDLEKFTGFISALKAQLGVLDGGQTIIDESVLSRGSQGTSFNPTQSNLTKVMGELQQYIQQQGLENSVSMELNRRGLVIRFSGQILYDLGKAEIKPEGAEILSKIAASLAEIPNDVAVEGHTDDLPINNENFPSNWELSTTRATNVIKFFIEKHGLNPARFSAAGYSEYRPLYPNNSSLNRAKNRRVEVVILNTIRS